MCGPPRAVAVVVMAAVAMAAVTALQQELSRM
jgi:hypothetical protein